VLSSAAVSACGQSPETTEERSSTATQAILNGAPADEAKYGAVGALVYTIPDTDIVLDVFCSALVLKQAGRETAGAKGRVRSPLALRVNEVRSIPGCSGFFSFNAGRQKFVILDA